MGVLGLAAALRLPRVLNRWDEVAWLYAAYPTPTVDALRDGRLVDAWTTFTGLHPPLWPLLHAATELAAPIPLLWLGLSAALSWAAVALVGRQSLLAGLVLATGAVQLHYAAEVNQYPLATAGVALAWASARALGQGRGHWLWVTAGVAVAGWSHVLGGAAAALACALLPAGLGARALGAAALTSAPLWSPALDLLSDTGTARQPAFELPLVAADLRARFGLLGLGLGIPAAVGARRAPHLALSVVALAALLAGLIAARIAAPHQFPYLLFFGPPLALLIAEGARGPRMRAWVIGVCLLQGAAILRLDLQAAHATWRDPPRAIDQALGEADRPWTCPPDAPPSPSCAGDAVLLLAPAGINDDDKRRTSPTLWRISPWQRLPRVQPYGFDWGDHRRGQPRLVDGIAVYVADQPHDRLFDLLDAHERVWVVVYEQGQREPFTEGLVRRFDAAPTRIAGDDLYRLADAP